MATIWSLPLRFRKKIRIEGECWVWIAAKYPPPGVYGKVFYLGKARRAHRAVFHIINGYWPPDDTHHTCENKLCVNPAHLVARTRAEHKQDHRKTHCINGHRFTPKNTYYDRSMGSRRCRKCHNRHRKVK